MKIMRRTVRGTERCVFFDGPEEREESMKLIHLSDLHLGKRVNEFSMIEDQEYILRQILDIVEAEQPEAVLIAGDVYDKAVPSAEAVGLFDRFLNRLADGSRKIFVISGNHDSAERIAFGRSLMDRSGVYLSPVFHGPVEGIPVWERNAGREDDPVMIYLLPFIKPIHARKAFPEQEESINSYSDALDAAIRAMDIDPSKRNVLVAHQFVTGASRSDSEEISVGGLDNVNADVFSGFDYAALGHIHNPQQIGERVRYCGTPLKYSFSEAGHEKSVTVTELGPRARSGRETEVADGRPDGLCPLRIREIPLTPVRDMKEIRGSFDQVTDPAYAEQAGADRNYFRIILTDERDVPDAIGRLRKVYPYVMRLDYDNARTRRNREIDSTEAVREQSPEENFDAFYALQNNRPMTEEERRCVRTLIEEIWGGEA